MTPPSDRGRQAEAGRDRSDPARAAERRPTPPMRWRRPSARRSSRTSPGSASTTAPSPAKSASAWSPRSRNSRRTAAASRPACSIRRSAACSPTPREARQENVGWKIVTDAGTGARLGMPTKLVPQQSTDANGAKWSSPTGTIQIQLARRKEANPTTAKLAEQEKKEPPAARSTTPWSSRISSCCRACRA